MMFHLNILVMKHALILLFGLLAGSHLQAQEALVSPMHSCVLSPIHQQIELVLSQRNTQPTLFIGCCSRPPREKAVIQQVERLVVCEHARGEKHEAACYALLSCGHSPIQHRDIPCEGISEHHREAADVVLMVREENHNIPPR
jgi:hypothetical protein